MSSIIIKELYDSDDIYGILTKVNFNFDQIIAAGGGPQGPIGPQGILGPAGIRGIRGSEWFGATGGTGIINIPTDGELRDNDFRLESDGVIQYYSEGDWINTGLNISGPVGPAGPIGDGSISVIHSQPSNNGSVVPNVSDRSGGKITLSDHVINVNTTNDKDDYDSGVGYIDKGQDYIAIGYGNNSLVLGHYLSMFRDNGVFNPHFSSFPTEEVDIPMLMVAQNDYMNPYPTLIDGKDPLPEFRNGIAIGLNLTQGSNSGEYDPIYNTPYFGNYESFTKLGILNRNFDFGIQSVGHIEQRSFGSNKFRLSAGYTRPEIKNITSIKDWSNIYTTDSYTEYAVGDNFFITDDTALDNNIHPGIGKQFAVSMGNISLSSNYSRTVAGSLLTSINSTVIGRNANTDNLAKNANELVIINDKVDEEELTSDIYNKRRRITDSTFAFNKSNTYRNLKFRIGQSRQPTNESPDSSKNLFYIGQGYDTPIVGYSSLNFRASTGDGAMGNTASSYGLLPSVDDWNWLGYNLIDGIAPSTSSVDIDKSLTRLGIFPGFFNQKRNAVGNLDPGDPDGNSNMLMYLDEGHKKLPTGSLDLYGTVRIREYGLAEDKEGYVAVNAGHGIVKWEEPNKVGTPTGGITMVSEIAMSKFNFFTRTQKHGGSTSSGGSLSVDIGYWSYRNETGGGTGCYNQWSQAFPGKGSDDWEGYYICNGAILADTRDIFARGAFSTEYGLNAYASENPMPSVQDNALFENYDTYSANYSMNSVVNSFTSNTATDFKRSYKNWWDALGSRFGSQGLSVLAPNENDSGFRVVLPNYFGRFPKQMFPDSNTIALSFRDDSATPVGTYYYPTTTYYKENSNGEMILNNKYPLKSGFYQGGFPYIKGQHLPIHQHYMGAITSVKLGEGTAIMDVYDVSDNLRLPDTVGGYDKTSGVPTQENSGRRTSIGNRTIGTPPDNNYTDRDHDNTYMSNWLDDTIVNGIGARSQKFHDPVFKGTYFAINLRGLKNPNRGDSVIPDFDFIAGVPMAGFNQDGTNPIDMSWYANAATPDYPAVINGWDTASTKGRGGAQAILSNIDTGATNLGPIIRNDAIEEFQCTFRNENTMNPFTLIGTELDGGIENLSSIYKNIYSEPNT